MIPVPDPRDRLDYNPADPDYQARERIARAMAELGEALMHANAGAHHTAIRELEAVARHALGAADALRGEP